jgi:hypothetical protein
MATLWTPVVIRSAGRGREYYKMPIFDFGGYPQVPAVLPGLRVLATMNYPDDLDRRAELHATLVVDLFNMAKDDSNSGLHSRTTESLEIILGARHLGGSREEVLGRAREATCRGSVAGELLIILSQLAKHAQRGSVNKACHVLAKAGGAGKATSGGMLIPFENRTAI